MGGGGGGFFSGTSDITKLTQKIRDSEAKARDQSFDSRISEIIDKLLTRYNNRDRDAIQKHLDTIKQSLEKDIAGSVDLLFGGSVAKHTYVDGLSDVDILVLLDQTDLVDKSPAQAKDYFFHRLKVRFPKSKIIKGQLAVTVRFGDIDIQLLPSVRHLSGYKISDESGESWSALIKPRVFAQQLSTVNQTLGNNIVPTIKIVKSILSELPERHRLSGYHTEALATLIFESYDGAKNTKSMLAHFFEYAQIHILKPIQDKTGQSIHVDDYLDEAMSRKRQLAANALSRISRRIRNADGAHLMEEWEDILGAL
ncbi:MAG: CBASS oligonucleotide cyclase [Syntrophobacteraceae bacterium]